VVVLNARDGAGGARRGPAQLARAGTLPIEPLPGCVAQAEISRWALGSVGVILGKLGGLRQVVPPRAREFRDEVFLGVNIAGMAVARQGGQELTPQAGDAVLFSNAEAGFTSTRPRSSQFLGLRLPRRILAPLVPNLDRDRCGSYRVKPILCDCWSTIFACST